MIRLNLKGNYREIQVEEMNTLQVFITNKCQLRCEGCFYSQHIGKDDMSFSAYESIIDAFSGLVSKIVILGGEPTLHPLIGRFVRLNERRGLKTTIYTNGHRPDRIRALGDSVSCRVGVHGFDSSEKPLTSLVNVPGSVVYMLRKDNAKDLLRAATYAEECLSSTQFYISSIRDIAKTGNFWDDTSETISFVDYLSVVQNFLDEYKGDMDIHIARRGVIGSQYHSRTSTCRFGNVLHDGSLIQCPLDISLGTTTRELVFNKRRCTKSNECIQRKIVLRKVDKVVQNVKNYL